MESATEATLSTNAQNSPLLSKIPAELRIEIYRLALVSKDSITVNRSQIRGQRSLLQTCHQIREEASKIYYSENAFTITSARRDINRIPQFVSTKDKSIGQMISKLTITHFLDKKQEGKVDRIMGCVVFNDTATQASRRQPASGFGHARWDSR